MHLIPVIIVLFACVIVGFAYSRIHGRKTGTYRLQGEIKSPSTDAHNSRTNNLARAFSEYPFLEEVDKDLIPNPTGGRCSIKYLYDEKEDTHYRIDYSKLHEDEFKLSTLRVKLFEQIKIDSHNPHLRCSVCGKPVMLIGNPKSKGQITSFRHFTTEPQRTGSSDIEQIANPIKEDIADLEMIRSLFSNYSAEMNNVATNKSFLLIPNTNRNYPGDVTFSHEGKKVATIFASAPHPLDFIYRRFKTTSEMGYVPLWILSPSFFESFYLSLRDLSAFSMGYVCTIDDDCIEQFHQNGEMILLARNFNNGEYMHVSLSGFINDSDRSAQEWLSNPYWEEKTRPRRRRKTISDNAQFPKEGSASAHAKKKEPLKRDRQGELEATPETKPERNSKNKLKTIDLWEGRRTHIKGDLYIERLDTGFGILNLKTNRFIVYAIYDEIKVTEDLSQAILILHGKDDRIVKL